MRHIRSRTCCRLNRWSLACALALGASVAGAATVNCGVGDRVAGEFGGGEIGTIAEIGRQSPHVGAYRIVFSWSPRGEWYHPNTWDVHPEGSADRCQPAQGGGAAGPDVGDDDPAPVASCLLYTSDAADE